MNTRRLRCVIYTRISRDDSGLGKANDRQEEECRRKADYKNYDIVKVIRDVSVSAYSGKDRPGWREVIEMVKAGEVDVVLAYHLDRVTRSMRDLEELIDLSQKHDVGIDTATGDIELTSDMGRMIARILAAVARQEVERKSARQKLAYRQRANEGLPHGLPTFGYMLGNMELLHDEAEAIVDAANDVLEGTALSEIARRWQTRFPVVTQGTTQRPRKWSPQGVKHVLTNPMYAGIRMHRGEEVGGIACWPAVFDGDMHLALVGLLTQPSRMKGGVRMRRRIPTTLLTGIATCAVCQQATKATKAHGKYVYGCRGGNHINTLRIEADALVLATLADRLSRPDMLDTITASSDVNGERFRAAQSDAATLRDRKDKLARAFAAGAIDDDQLAAGTSELNTRLADAEAVLLSAPETASLRGLAVGTPEVREQVLALPLERQRQLVEAWLAITLVPIGKGRKSHLPKLPIEEQVLIDEAWSAAA